MLLAIPEPAHYYSESDEDHFFAWLQSIPAIQSAVGTPKGITLTIHEPMEKLSFHELVGLMTRYQLDRSCLRQLCEAQVDPWFNDPQNYWYTSVFV